MILSLVSITLLLLRNNHISLHQSLNFVLFSLNHSESGTMFLDITACSLLFIVTSASAADISLFNCLYIPSKALFVICKDPSLSNSVSISSIYLELVLVLLIVYATHVSFIVRW